MRAVPGWGLDSGGWSEGGPRQAGAGARRGCGEGKPPPSFFVSRWFRAQVSRHGNACGRAVGTGGGGGVLRCRVGASETGETQRDEEITRDPGAQTLAPRPVQRGLPRPTPGGEEAADPSPSSLLPDTGTPGTQRRRRRAPGRRGPHTNARRAPDAPDKEPPPLAPHLGLRVRGLRAGRGPLRLPLPSPPISPRPPSRGGGAVLCAQRLAGPPRRQLRPPSASAR